LDSLPPSKSWARDRIKENEELSLKRPKIMDIYKIAALNAENLRPHFERFFFCFFVFVF
jgi:hypothetical protein